MFALASTHLASRGLGKNKRTKKTTICNSCNKLQCVLSVLLPDAQNNLVSCALQWQCSVMGCNPAQAEHGKVLLQICHPQDPGGCNINPSAALQEQREC